MRPSKIIAAAVVATALVVSGSAFADDAKGVEAARSPAPAGADKKPAMESQVKETGFVADTHGSAVYLGGSYVRNFEMSALAFGGSLRVGYAFSRHLSLLGGVDAAFGTILTTCVDTKTGQPSDACKILTVKAPINVQYAFSNRATGAFVEGGVSAANVTALIATNGFVVLSPVDLALGVGTRIKTSSAAPKAGDPAPLEFRLRGEGGMFTHFVSGGGSGEIPASERALHYVVSLSLGRQF